MQSTHLEEGFNISLLKDFSDWLKNPDTSTFFDSTYAKRQAISHAHFRNIYEKMDKQKEEANLEKSLYDL